MDGMKQYNRIMLGRKSCYSAEAVEKGIIGCDWFEGIDLSQELSEK